MKKLAISDGSPVVCYEESDQTPVKGEAKRLLRVKWSQRMDYFPYKTPSSFTEWCKALYAGDYEGILRILEGKTEEEIREGLIESVM